jgi:tetratricopeptide (TPR) repeat protein
VTEVIAALDEWAGERRRKKKAAGSVAALAAALDKAGSRRAELRSLLARGNLERELALGGLAMALRPVPVPVDVGLGDDRTRLRQLAATTDPASEPILGLLTLTRALQEAEHDALAERLLRAALRARPREVVLYDALGKLLEEQRRPRWRDAADCYRAARALRPELGEALANALVESAETVEEGFALYAQLVRERKDNPWLHLRFGNALDDQRRHQEAEGEYRKALALQPDYAEAHNDLGVSLSGQDRYPEAEAAFRGALRLKHDFPQAHVNLGNTLNNLGRHQEAAAACREALRLDPDYAKAHTSLGVSLNNLGRHQEAAAACRASIRLEPNRPAAYTNLGDSLDSQGRYPEGEAAFREALRLQPDWVPALVNLGVALNHQGRYAEAEAAYRKAIRLQPNLFKAHLDLGAALDNQGRYAEAEAAYREALHLEPDSPHTYCNLGMALYKQGRLAEALAFLRRGDELGRKLPDWSFPSADWVRDCERLVELDDRRTGLLRGETTSVAASDLMDYALYRHSRGELAEAIALLRQAVALQNDLADAPGQTHLPVLAAQILASPTTPGLASVTTQLLISKRFEDVFALADAHGNLSWLLHGQGKWQESVEAARQAIRLKPSVGWYHNNLGWSLQQLGRLEEAAAEYREALKFDPAHKLARGNLKNLEAVLALAPRLDAVRRGEAYPGDADECVKLAELCRLKKLYRTATHLFADAFAAAPKLADDLDQAHRYNAACSAILAAAGQAVDASNVSDEAASLLRRQALRWLRADLALRAPTAEGDNLKAKRTFREKLEYWQADLDLASVRDRPALDRLPEDERAAWQALWRDADELAERVAKEDAPTKGRKEPETRKTK